MVLYKYIYIYLFFLRTIGLRFSLNKNFRHCAKKILRRFFANFCHEIGCENDQTYIFRFVRYLSTFFHTYLSINIHFQFIIITNISFVTNPAYFVHHLASPVVSFWGHMIFPNITLFIYTCLVCLHWWVVKLPNQYAFHRKFHREPKAPFGNIHFSHIQ